MVASEKVEVLLQKLPIVEHRDWEAEEKRSLSECPACAHYNQCGVRMKGKVRCWVPSGSVVVEDEKIGWEVQEKIGIGIYNPSTANPIGD